VAGGFGGEIRRAAVEPVQRPQGDAVERSSQLRGEAAPVVRRKAGVLVELEHRGAGARQRPAPRLRP
jgi:hypothetical protein